ncbi:MAG TPA: hypothetical protein VG410_03290 [Solirubrobacteraceae bacterium]|jgi:hypothetical protein|nr:hypothetical protein [Solirubrobacteraceae bacterium]
MRTRRRATIRDLRLAIDCLPSSTRIAMLDGIRSNEIIVGAYAENGGVCPMLAAHRAGGRTNFISFARAWDRLAFDGSRVGVARRATERELLILRSHLEASLLADELPEQDLAAAVAEHRALLARRGGSFDSADGEPGQSKQRRRRDRPGDRDRSRELRSREGWAWMRVFRRYEDYERALELVYAERDALDRRDERELVG